jgi:uncharacterized protein (TIGR03083 family)
MQLTPRYDGPPILDIGLPTVDPGALVVQQRRRLSAAVAGLTDAQWATQSRCDEWTVADVVNHLATVTRFFEISISAGRAGQPTRFLTTFDPVTSPAELVAAARDVAPLELLARLDESTDALAAVTEGMAPEDWAVLGEAPPGHISIYGVALHALWDSWVHERDILLPLGIEPAVDPVETSECLRYGVALGPAFHASLGGDATGRIAVEATDPEVHLTVDVGRSVLVTEGSSDDADVHLTGSMVDLLEALSYRRPLDVEVAPEHRWLLDGLGTVFDKV